MSAIRITYRKSAIGYAHDQRATLVALGLKRRHQTVEHEATPAIRGMVAKVRHLVSVDGEPADTAAGMAVLAAHSRAAGNQPASEPS
ncbi:MAG: 50S ribosomal protein L30 [Chloroflexi bacterium]|nr:MAG: 50S ribosomal protein L30 [Chloroflexota bacterium]